MMASDYRSPAATAFSPWGKMPLATVEIPTGAHRDLGGSECASVKSFRVPAFGAVDGVIHVINNRRGEAACRERQFPKAENQFPRVP